MSDTHPPDTHPAPPPESAMHQFPGAHMTTEQRLEAMEATLRRICLELDLVIHGMRALLEAQGLRAKAQSIGEQLDQLHEERDG